MKRLLSGRTLPSVNRRIMVALVTVGAITCAVKLAAMMREAVVARHFGTGDEVDSFLIAFVIPSFAVNVLAGAFITALMPVLIKVRERDGKEAELDLAARLAAWAVIGLLCALAVLAVAAPLLLPLVGSGFTPSKLALTESLFFLLLPLLVFGGLNMVWSTVLNAGEVFAVVAAAPLATPLASVLALVLFGRHFGIRALAVGTMLGFALESLVLALGLARRGWLRRPRLGNLDPDVREVLSQYAPVLVGSFLMTSSVLADQTMAAMLGSGSVAVLSYGSKVVAVAVSIGSLSLASAVFPYFSRMVAAADWRTLRHTLVTYAALLLTLGSLATLLVAWLSSDLVRVLFERGAFTSADTAAVARVQTMYALQIPFAVLGIMISRQVSALGRSHVLMWVGGLNLVTNVVLNLVLMSYLGAAGIALSTSIVHALSAAVMAAYLVRHMPRSEEALDAVSSGGRARRKEKSSTDC